MVERIDIERALDDLISNEEGMRFQGLAVALAQRRWPELIACERHHDLGLDAYASATNSLNGVGKGLACSITATYAKLNGDAKTAKEHYGPFSNLIFATPRKVTKENEKEWADKIRAEYGYELTVIPRADIIPTLQTPENAWMCRVHLRIPVPFRLPPGEILQRVREAATEEASHWAAHRRLVGKPLISLSAVMLDKSGNDTRDIVSTARLRSLLARGGRFVLEAPAGRGKTTALIQIAQSAGEGIPILVDLPRWIRSGLDILDYIARIPAFRARALEASAFARSPNDEPYLFLLNGWNEISSLHSQQAVEMFREVARQFPAAGILVATRSHHIVPPLPSSSRSRLLQLAPDQRFQYLVDTVGKDRALTVAATISTDRMLDDLTRTPFILSEVATIVRAGQEIPKTKLGLLRAVIGLMERSEEHAPHLQGQPLWALAEDYLQALAVQLTARGDVVVPEAEARSICHSVATKLANTGQISTTPEPVEILSALSSHHVLERLDYPSVSFRFEHQQFQEYYAAREVRGILDAAIAAGSGEKSDAFIRTYVNLPSWEEPLRMIAEDLGPSQIDIAAGQFLVRGALRIDPIIAGTLFHLCAPPIQDASQADLRIRLRTLFGTSTPQYRQIALAGMLASGSPSFRDILIPLLTAEDQQIRLGVYRAGPEFQPSCLGEDWQQTVAKWSEQHRIEFVSELTMHQGRIEVGLAFVRTDPSSQVRLEALRALIWTGQRETAIEILRSLTDDDFREAIQKFHPDEIPLSLRDRAIEGYRALLKTAPDPKLRLHLTLALAEFDDPETRERLKAELNSISPELVRELADYQLRKAVDILRQADPQWLSDWVVSHAIKGVLWRDTWLSLILGIPTELQAQLLHRVRTENLRLTSGQGVIAVLQTVATPNLAMDAFFAVRDAHRELGADPHNQEKQGIDWQLKGLLRSMPRSIVIEGLAEILAQEHADEDLRIIAELFGQIGAPDSEQKEPLPDPLRQRVRAYFKAAVPVVLTQEDLGGEVKAHLALALAQTGQLEDADDLIALIRSDIQRVREGQAARMRGDRSPKARQSSASWSPWHVQAIVNLMGEKSEAILRDLLNEPEYEMDAACGLQVIASKAEPGPSAIMAARNGPIARDYRKICTAAGEWHVSFHNDLREHGATAVRQRISTLLEESKTGDPKSKPYHFHLKELARVLATLDPHGSKSLILDILELPGQFDGWQRIALLERLTFAGVALPAERILPALEPVFAHLRKNGVYNDSASLFGHVLCILPFLDPPARGIERMRELLSEFTVPLYAQRDLLMAIGQCPDEAGLTFLVDLARDNVGVFQNIGREWLDAVAACPLPRAKVVLLRFIDPEVDVSLGDPVLPDYTIDLLAGRIADLARTDEALRARILELTGKPIASDQLRVILAKVIASLDRPQALVEGLSLIDDSAPQPLPYELWRAIEDFFLEKRPYKTSSQSYTLVPRAAADVKKRLFEILKTDPKRSRTASNLLAQIEEWRLQYGRPASEPRHPMFESGEVWPPD